MTPANLQLVIGVMDVLLRMLGLVMALGMIFLFSLHSFAARSVRPNPSAGATPTRPVFPQPQPFILRSTRPAQSTRARRAA